MNRDNRSKRFQLVAFIAVALDYVAFCMESSFLYGDILLF